ncbi:unnamed protein product [Ostreobium quekettii]|uniref:Rubredoxin-like domain-containing protein n=1 Tax=Ostreobium quekettii TaxID=121088 RepID=A0A8S1J9L1_9CHLO|nr:unnamed protein product [Ostreobium quekettii]|eukprot:evm.model.scf_183.4 EVM.evm.TU.scf_183.4   scf_183:19228-22758(-)
MRAAVFAECGAVGCRAGGDRRAGWHCRGGPVLPRRVRSQFGSQANPHLKWCLRAEAETSTEDSEVEFVDEEAAKRQKAEALRAQEKFMVIGEGNATCSSCGYEYLREKGDKEFPVPAGTSFLDLPDDYVCPLCGAEKSKFRSSSQEVAGFAVNQGYGFGANTMTSGQKQLLIWGSFALFFLIFLSGYLLT